MAEQPNKNTDPNKKEDFKFNFNFNFPAAGSGAAAAGAGGAGGSTNANTSSSTAPASGGSGSTTSQPFKFDFGTGSSSSAAGSAATSTSGSSQPFKFDFGGSSSATSNPKDNPFLPVVTDKLNSMVGKSSGFVENLPPIVQYRIEYLRELNEESNELDHKMEAEIRAIELKYQELSRPIYLKRKQVVAGEVEPELKPPATTEESDSTTGSSTPSHNFTTRPENTDNIKGIPEFWLTTLKNCYLFEEAITAEDEEALKYLIDVTTEILPEEPHSFRLDFHFSANPFLSNTTLSKTYHMAEGEDSDPSMCESIDATKVEWKKGQDLVKKQVGEINEGGSFFMFFNPPNIPEEGEEEEGDIERVENDFQMASILRDLVPNALEWYLGEANGNELVADIFGGGEGAEIEEEEEDEEDEEEDQDYQPVQMKRGGGGRRGGGGGGSGARGGMRGQRPPEECKQQ